MATPNPPSAQSPWQNSANTPGAVRTPDSDGATANNQHSASNTDGQDAIREGKQKARETMAAAGLSAGQLPAQTSIMSNGSARSNGAPQLSRKRSRDGTQLPVVRSIASSEAADEARPSHDEILLDRYVQRDLIHSAAMNDQTERSRDLLMAKEKEKDFYVNQVAARRKQDPGSVYGYGYSGYGNGTTNARTQIVYSSNRGPPKGRRTKQLHITRKDNAQQADHHEELVPIRLDIELDKLRLRDTFTWNLHEKVLSQDQFTDYLLEDLKIPQEAVPDVARQVKAEMQEQINNYYPHIIVEDGPLEPGRPYADHKDDEMRIQVKLNITIGRITLLDQFEWDINDPLNSPEEFARQMAWENALSGEFTTAIAHSIREQSQLYTKSLYLTNHAFDGRPVEDPELKDSFLPGPVHSAFRPAQTQKDWMPYMYEMTEADMERTETSMMREHRAQKRQLNRRGGPALPDLKERQRTVRSLLVHSVIPGAVETFETTGILKTRRGGRSSKRRNDADIDSDDLDSDESGADSPAPSAIVNTGGTARTRGMRGAAAQAQANMRAGYNRSATPDSQMLAAPHTESRTSARRSHLREESIVDDNDQLIVKLKISKSRLKSWWDGYQAKKRASAFPLSGYASQPPPPPSVTNLAVGTPTRASTSTPAMTPRSLPQARSTPQPNGNHSRAQSTSRSANANVQYGPRGAVETDLWPGPDDTAPPPPPWLHTSIDTLRERHPNDNFEPVMRPYMIDLHSNDITRASDLSPTDPPPPGFKFQYLPRIRCNDCPGKLYTAQPDRVVQDFEVHLRNKNHRAKVEDRMTGKTTATSGRGSATPRR